MILQNMLLGQNGLYACTATFQTRYIQMIQSHLIKEIVLDSSFVYEHNITVNVMTMPYRYNKSSIDNQQHPNCDFSS